MDDVENCVLRRKVVAAPYSTSSDGHGCGWTGGHCIPSANCAQFRADHAREEQYRDEVLEAIEKIKGGHNR